MNTISHSLTCECSCECVSLTDHTSRCVWENRASGEHGGPCVKLDSVVCVDRVFPWDDLC